MDKELFSCCEIDSIATELEASETVTAENNASPYTSY